MTDQPGPLAPVVLRAELTIGDFHAMAQQQVGGRAWAECDEDYREFLRAKVRRALGEILIEHLAPAVTAHHESPVGEELWRRAMAEQQPDNA
jgi:hypothetical protein